MTKAAKVYRTADLQAEFTKMVNKYLEGRTLNINTMAGSEGEIAKVDIRDGKYVYRVLMIDFHEWEDDEYGWGSLDGIEIQVRRYEEELKSVKDRRDTIWNHEGEYIEGIKLYQLDEYGRRDAYAADKTFVIKAHEIHRARRQAREDKGREINLDKAGYKKLLNIVRQHKGHKSTLLKNVDKLIRHKDHYSITIRTDDSRCDSCIRVTF